MNVSIVGGGISGCLLALKFSDLGHAVSLYEASDCLGGICRDVQVGENLFFSNCQYLNVGAESHALFKRVEGVDLFEFPHRYGSVNDLFGDLVIYDDFAQVVVPGQSDVTVSDHDNNTVAERLGAYEPVVADALLSWAKRFGDLHNLDAGNCTHMQLGRVFYSDAVERVRNTKEESPWANDMLGLPRHLFEPPLAVQAAALPAHGYNNFFDAIHTEMVKRGVMVHLQAPVTPRMISGKLEFSVRKKKLPDDLKVWCANPTALAHLVTGRRLEMPAMSCFNLVATLDIEPEGVPVYYQTFLRDSPFLRIFKYDLQGVSKITVEGFDTGRSCGELITELNALMRRMGWACKVTSEHLVLQKRYTLLTLSDKETLSLLASSLAEHAVIPGGWQFYGRDEKVKAAFSAFQCTEASSCAVQ